jgi:hypothetical protein
MAAPIWQNIPSQRVTEGQTLDIDLSNYVSDADGDTLTYGFTGPVWIKPTDATPRPEETWAGISGSILTLTPQVGDARSYGITAEVSDGSTTVNKFFYVLVDPATQWERDENGWTILNPTTGSADPVDDSRMIYVSNNGSDSNDGLSPQTPKLTVQAAYNLARNNYPDWVHLERGGTYDFNVISWSKDGKSLSEAQVITAYGEGPMPVVTNKITIGGAMRNNLVVRDIHILQADNSANSGISMLSGGSNFLIEGCKIENTADGFNISFNPKTNVQIRRNIVTKSFPRPIGVFNSGSRASNMFANSIDGFLIEENVFHAGGHSGNRAEATIFSHGLYLETGLRNQTIRRNILIDASSNAISNNGEGDMYENLILRGAIGIFMRAAPASAYDNVILYGADINSPQSINRGFGIIVADRWKGPGGPGIIQRNLIAHNDSVGKREAIVIEDYVNAEAEPFGVTIDSNVIVNWEANAFGQVWVEGNDATDYTSINVTNNIFDASGLTSYMVYLSEDNSPLPDAYLFDGNSYISARNESEWFRDAGGNVSLSEWISNEEATAATWDSGFTNRGAGVDEYMVANSLGTDVDDFLDGALQNNRLSWNTAYTARPVIDYVRAAHDMPVLPPVSYVEESPVTGELALIGASGGQAPHPCHVYADIEKVGTTWSTGTTGSWSEGRWAFQLIDESSNTIYDSGLMDLTCPISGVTASAYNRYGASPNAGCVVFDPGTYHWRVKYQNKLGIWSDWVDSASFTVAENTRTKIYVDGNAADDTGNGLTPETAKKTLNAALSLIDGNDYEVILKDDTTIDVTTGNNISSRSGIWIHRSGDGTNKPIVVGKNTSGPIYAIQCGSDTVIDGFEFEYDGVGYRFLFGTDSNKSNIAWMNLDTHEINAFAELPTGTSLSGVVVYGCTMIEPAQRYMIFADGPSVFNVLGCTWDKGSVTEHIIRLMWQNSSAVASKFFSIDFCTLDQANRGKTMLRAFHRRFLGVYRCDLRGGSLSISNLDTSAGDQDSERFEDYRFDCCRLLMESETSSPHSLAIYEGAKSLVFASCHVYRDNPQLSPAINITKRTNGNTAPIEGIKFLNCALSITTTSMESVVKVGLNYDAENVIDLNFNGCLILTSESTAQYHYYNLISLVSGIPSTFTMTENVTWLATHLNPAIAGGKINIVSDLSTDPDTTYKDISTLNAETWATGNIQENLSVNRLTSEPSGVSSGWESVVTDISGVFESINGEVIDRTRSTWNAGAWHPAGSGINEPAGYSPDIISEGGGGEENNAPTWTSIPSQELNEGQIATVDLSAYASDADEGDSLTFSLVNPPSWVTIAGPVVTIAPQDGDEGLYTITARASDGTAATNTTFNVLVNRIPSPGNTGAASFIVVIG